MQEKSGRERHALMVLDAIAVLPAEFVPEGGIETATAHLEELRAGPLAGSAHRN